VAVVAHRPRVGGRPIAQVPVPVAGAKPQAAVQEISAIIRAPDETPAAGAEVVIVTPNSPSVDVLKSNWPREAKVANAQGRVSFPAMQEPWMMVVRHPSGY